ncbi:MAG TPA: hypothetical protein VGG61_09980, partial [Gemmataceae bacterium]
MAHLTRPRRPRSGRLTLPRLLSLASLCLLLCFIGWQVWLRTMQQAEDSVEEIPSAPLGTDANAAQHPNAEEPADNNDFVFRDNTTEQVITAAA